MGYIGIIPSNIRRDGKLTSNAKVVYCEITSLFNDDMCCEESNFTIGSYLGMSEAVVSSCISELSYRGYIDAQVSGPKRQIYLPEKVVFVEETTRKEKKKRDDSAESLAIDIVAFWKNGFGTKTRVTPKIISWVSSRLKSFTPEEILDAVANRYVFVSDSEWHNKPENIHHKTSLALVLKDDQVLQQNLDRTKPKEVHVSVRKINID
jgi:hypothetical protein